MSDFFPRTLERSQTWRHQGPLGEGRRDEQRLIMVELVESLHMQRLPLQNRRLIIWENLGGGAFIPETADVIIRRMVIIRKKDEQVLLLNTNKWLPDI